VQRHAARAVVVDLEPALFDDAAAARIQRVQRGAMPSVASTSRWRDSIMRVGRLVLSSAR
jgi:hypothetical protein